MDGTKIIRGTTSPLPTVTAKTKIEIIDDDVNRVNRKPYFCKMPLCKDKKKYKNLNGLKYHAKVEHPEIEFERLKGIDEDGE